MKVKAYLKEDDWQVITREFNSEEEMFSVVANSVYTIVSYDYIRERN